MGRATPAQRLQILMEMHRYNVELGRCYLEYRERITQVVISIYSGLLGVTFVLDLKPITIAFPIIVMVVSRFSEQFVLKFFERSEYHFRRARDIRKQLDTDFGTSWKGIGELFDNALQTHKTKFSIKNHPKWNDKILSSNVHERWASLHRLFYYSGFVVVLVVIITNLNLILNFVHQIGSWKP